MPGVSGTHGSYRGLAFLFFDLLPAFAPALHQQCSRPSQLHNVLRTGFEAVDEPLCFAISFFHVALEDADARRFLVYLLGTSAPYIVFPLLVAFENAQKRSGRVGRGVVAGWAQWALTYPVVWFALTQVATLGVTMTVYALAFSLASPSSTASGTDAQPPTSLDIVGIAITLVLGAALPSYALLQCEDPRVTALWQLFPLYIAAISYMWQRVHRSFVTAQPNTNSRLPIRILLASCILTSTYFHISTLSSEIASFDIPSIVEFFNPTLRRSESLPSSVKTFLQLDFFFSFASLYLVYLIDSLASGALGRVLGLIVVGSVGSFVLGPSAVLVGVRLYDEIMKA
ncbi:hypothetical protein DFP72DRAFT_915569 [Ephemerocybe angulata]|uniref:Uncharacterized protein n=1 Tax=Ephemerocybe angulata TaxID=980116 RepID=A0A8H6HKR3_9AGAR|nr:hypothetical protein DFP72DRAFT_915569 [Tulosesus angulatus]